MLSLIKDYIMKKAAKVSLVEKVVIKKKTGRPASKTKIQKFIEQKEQDALFEALVAFEASFNKLKSIIKKTAIK